VKSHLNDGVQDGVGNVVDALGEVDVHEGVEDYVEDACRGAAHAEEQRGRGGSHGAHVAHDGDEVDDAPVAGLVAHVPVAGIVAGHGHRRHEGGQLQRGVLAQHGQREPKRLDDLHTMLIN